jgi:hypothetical protein
MKSLPIVMLGLLAMVGAATRGGVAHNGHSATRVSGVAAHAGTVTIEDVQQRSTNVVLVLRRSDTTLFDLKVPASASIAAGNHGRISGTDLRSGDRLVLQHDGGLLDSSQRTVTVSGVVGYAPMSNRDVMTVQVTPSRTILVDITPETHFSDVTGAKTSPVDVVDADTVTIHGVLDATMDEVVSTQAIERSGPKITRSYSST